MKIDAFIRIARTIMDATSCTVEQAISNSAIPAEIKVQVQTVLEQEQLIVVRDPNMVEDSDRDHLVWLPHVDRNQWYYWPRLRSYLIDNKEWPATTVRSIDDSTDLILGAMEDPKNKPEFDTRALVVGYVQSGKTANYTSLIAKAVDTGYRLIIVLTGMHNTLRYQTQTRLDKELVGMINGVPAGVGRPLHDKEWFTLTKADQEYGDFDPGNAGPTVLNGNNPIILVVKKNGPVLEKLINWLDRTNEHTRKNLPCLIIDDEADQASINTRGNRPHDCDYNETDNNEDQPSAINGFIRDLLNMFTKKAYIAYTATPFANVLIDHNADDIRVGSDLYPKSFIMALARPHGYYGASEIFGTVDGEHKGIDVIRRVHRSEIPWLVPPRRSDVEDFEPRIPESLKRAIKDYVLAGATRIARGQEDEPTAMLIHTSYRTIIQKRLATLLRDEFGRYRDEWRYLREHGLRRDLRNIWETDFRPVIRSENVDLDISFEELQNHISTFFEQVEIKELHGEANDEIDYEREPNQKIIVIGGNRLSRGLTLEGLLVSYYVRPTAYYDTLMQMGRWFGYREGYADITRIYTTSLLERWFRDLATVEEELHREIARYKREKLTPLQVGVKIRQHSAMLVTSPLKMRVSQTVNISYENQLLQTITFPLNRVDWLRTNLDTTRGFLTALGEPTLRMRANQPIWNVENPDIIKEFLCEYKTDPEATRVRSERFVDYISLQNKYGELNKWIVAVIGRDKANPYLGQVNLNISGSPDINLINRSRIQGTFSLKAITSRADQEIGLNDEQIQRAEEMQQTEGVSYTEALRYVRPPQEGLLLLYPISKYSGYNLNKDNQIDGENEEGNQNREPLFENPDTGEHIIGIAIVFPHSGTAATVQYTIGSVGAGME